MAISEGRDTAQQRASSSTPRRIFSFRHPEAGTFIRFDDNAVMDVAREALPDVGIKEATWLNEYDNYYRSRDKGQLLPVLRVRYADPEETWLYIDPHRGMVGWREQRLSRIRRWLYNGLHKFDFPYLYSRPVWDISIILLSIGGLLLSVATLVPAFRRLRRHARKAVARTNIEVAESVSVKR